MNVSTFRVDQFWSKFDDPYLGHGSTIKRKKKVPSFFILAITKSESMISDFNQNLVDLARNDHYVIGSITFSLFKATLRQLLEMIKKIIYSLCADPLGASGDEPKPVWHWRSKVDELL